MAPKRPSQSTPGRICQPLAAHTPKAKVAKAKVAKATVSFDALIDAAVPPHTLILGTHPSQLSFAAAQYFANPANAFWWIAGDTLGFRHDAGKK
eukprot:CAMPEP_0183363474 /NCGR_PEP_ID=MMETSP0164_2-20130417/75331_1 /TAXON_ID=221442 /ORGANISM="Coccolithus pelagicus ssp braarudi, Strain PLY182g" /LENGTH=93 /DNA_ID=CAMNT_0025538579 /DNA_START=20 /DNA_END=298 /DNA_ORIENTATION=+